MPTRLTPRRPARRGTFVPVLALCLVGLFACTALAIDLGLLMVMRTECQDAADSAALVGARNLDNKPTSTNNNSSAAMSASAADLQNNVLLSANFQAGNVVGIQTGVYDYDTTATPNVFRVTTTSAAYTPAGGGSPNPGAAPSGKSWSAMTVEVTATQPTFFNRVMGVTSMQTGARATAVHRPRDVAVVLDMTGSMRYGTTCNQNNVFMSADPLYPQMGHYQRYTDTSRYTTSNPGASTTGSSGRPNPFYTTAGYTLGTGEYVPPNNYTAPTAGGPACVKDFLYDPGNLTSPATPQITPTPNIAADPAMPRGFHHWDPAVSDPGNPDNYVAPTYDYSGWWSTYDPTNLVVFPTPDTFATQADTSSTQKYVGDRWPRKKGAERTVASTTTWDPTTATGAAITAAEYLGWVTPYSSGSSLPTTITQTAATPGRTLTGNTNFRDAAWERYGYDLDVANYVTGRPTAWDPRWDYNIDTNKWVQAGGSGTSTAPAGAGSFKPRRRTDGVSFQGYSMGPGYWGKTFYVWPPDPRVANDWRRKFFLKGDGTAFVAQTNGATEDNSTTGTGNEHVDELLLTNGTGSTLQTPGTGTYQVNYAAVLQWIKQTPMTLPPNLRAGRVVYYTSIPSDVTTSGTTAADYDKLFWKTYIDYVLRCGSGTGTLNYSGSVNGTEGKGWPEGVTPAVNTNDLATYTATGATTADPRPYLPYTDNPSRPRSQFWFGPVTMMAFLANFQTQTDYNQGTSSNKWAGTVHESQAWQLKAGMNSALDDIRNNHPNDAVGLCYFSQNGYGNSNVGSTGIAVGCSQDWTSLKNALFYPLSLLNANQLGSPYTTEFRPYDTGLNYTGDANIPNAQGGTDPNSGLAMAYNILSANQSLPSTILPARPTSWPSPNPRYGRRGASKIVIFETDGVPNGHSNTAVNSQGYNSYYSAPSSWTSDGNGSANSITPALAIVDQIVAQTATGTSGSSGLSTPTSPARVYAIGFGDLFSTPSATFQGTARQFLLNVQQRGGTSASTDTIGTGPNYTDGTFPSYQIITGPYQTRIDSLKTAFQRIMQSGVQITLIE